MRSHEDEQLLADANARLKAARIRVTIRCRGEALYLRATLPPKPGSHRVKPGQYDLKTGLPLSRDRLRRAEAEAQHLGSALALKQFDWSDWLDEKPPEERAISEWIRAFKQHYMSTHSLSETTWQRHWQTVYDKLPQDGLLVAEILVAITPQQTHHSPRNVDENVAARNPSSAVGSTSDSSVSQRHR